MKKFRKAVDVVYNLWCDYYHNELCKYYTVLYQVTY